MTPDFDYSEVPFGFNYCLNKSCKQASTCLRYRLYTHIPAACQTIRIINPVYAATIDDVCPFFMPDKKVRYALGITHLLDHVPYSDAVSIKRQMLAHFKQATYYRCRRKERMLFPIGKNWSGTFVAFTHGRRIYHVKRNRRSYWTLFRAIGRTSDLIKVIGELIIVILLYSSQLSIHPYNKNKATIIQITSIKLPPVFHPLNFCL